MCPLQISRTQLNHPFGTQSRILLTLTTTNIMARNLLSADLKAAGVQIMQVLVLDPVQHRTVRWQAES